VRLEFRTFAARRMTLFSFIRRLANFFGATFALVFAWKIILLVFTAQPIPANDAFFYDGPVVNFLLNGHYCNPSIVMGLPFSATQIFSAYPPVYQAALLPWMFVFGTSALSAIWFHSVLFGFYLLTLLAIFRRLQTPAWCVNLAGLFLFSLTFNDRPDALAQLFGMLAVYAWVRSLAPVKSPGKWSWLATLLVVLALWTDPEIGGIYFGCLWLLTLGAVWQRKQTFPAWPMLALVVLPPVLVAAVKFGRPDWWSGFLEHALQTPSLSTWHLPRRDDILKIIRAIPGILAVAVILLARARRKQFDDDVETHFTPLALMSVALFLSLSLMLGCLLVFTADWIWIANYFQPLVVGFFFALENRIEINAQPKRCLLMLFVALALLGSIRAIGMSTWGVACAADKNYSGAIQIVRANLDQTALGSTVVMSSAFLYEAMRHPQIRTLHEDWLHRADDRRADMNGDTRALLTIKPRELILTQYDFYRRFEKPIAELQVQPEIVAVKITNTAKIPSPDSIHSMQRVVQHISWAPIIVELDWK
jgi:hypothetical protein